MSDKVKDTLVWASLVFLFLGGMAAAVWAGNLGHANWWQTYIGLVGAVAMFLSLFFTMMVIV